jgi:hypothetical protein
MAGEAEERKDTEGLRDTFQTMCDELMAWREQHPQASIDEIFGQITPRRRELMGKLAITLALRHGDEACLEVPCKQCGVAMVYKGEAPRYIEHLEGEAELVRAYFHCPHCEGGVFPPGPTAKVGQTQLDAGDYSASPGHGGRNPFCAAGRQAI